MINKEYKISKPIRKTLGKDLNQDLLKSIIETTFGIDEEDFVKELMTKWQSMTLEQIIENVLGCANDLYMDDILDPDELIQINDLLIELRME